MNQNDQSDKFLRQGLKDYAEAKDTVSAFERLISDRIDQSIANRKWKPIQNPTCKEAKSEGENSEYWIAARITGKCSKFGETEISCGIWWKPEPEFADPILYAGFWSKPEQVRGFKWDSSDKEIKSLNSDGNTCLFLPVPANIAIEQPLNRLLDHLLTRLS